MFYSGNTFEITVHNNHKDGQDLSKFCPETRAKMRKVALTITSAALPTRRGRPLLDQQLWDGVFQGLSKLTLVVLEQKHPSSPFLPSWAATRWRSWLVSFTAVLGYLALSVPPAAELVVDVNKVDRLVQAVEAALPGRCWFEELPDGGFWLRRDVMLLLRHETPIGGAYGPWSLPSYQLPDCTNDSITYEDWQTYVIESPWDASHPLVFPPDWHMMSIDGRQRKYGMGWGMG